MKPWGVLAFVVVGCGGDPFTLVEETTALEAASPPTIDAAATESRDAALAKEAASIDATPEASAMIDAAPIDANVPVDACVLPPSQTFLCGGPSSSVTCKSYSELCYFGACQPIDCGGCAETWDCMCAYPHGGHGDLCRVDAPGGLELF